MTAAAAAGGTQPAPGARSSTLALVGGMLLDGYEVPPLHHAAVVINGNRIEWVGRAADAKIPPGATVVDTSGRVMMPGLVDLHVHLLMAGHGNIRNWYRWLVDNHAIERVMEISAAQLLAAGVTSAVDLGAPLQEILRVRDRVNRLEVPGPRLWVSGSWIGRGPAPTSPASTAWQGAIDTPEDAAAAATQLAGARVDVLKAYNGLTPAHYQAIVKVARAHRLPVHAHVYEEDDVRHALESGVDVIQHAGSAGSAPPYSEQMLRMLAASGRPVVVTAAHRTWMFPATRDFPERLEDPQLKADFSVLPGMWTEVQSSLKAWHTVPYYQQIDRELQFRDRGLRQFIETGVMLAMGTDSGTTTNFHTEAMWRELAAHVEMGLTPQRAISAATRLGARVLGRGHELGTVEPGKLADLIVVRGNPLEDIRAVADVETVVKDGVLYKGPPAPPVASSQAPRRK
ncbi:MAG: amidohydrolase family protein [Vicinamibacterales bacterium]